MTEASGRRPYGFRREGKMVILLNIATTGDICAKKTHLSTPTNPVTIEGDALSLIEKWVIFVFPE